MNSSVLRCLAVSTALPLAAAASLAPRCRCPGGFDARLARRFTDALLERRHEVHYLGAGGRLRFRRTDLVALELLVDELAQGGVVVVLELLRLERAGLALDELNGEVHHLPVRLLVGDVLKEAGG